VQKLSVEKLRGLDLNLPCMNGNFYYPIVLAAYNQDYDFIKSLLVAGADPKKIDKGGITALHAIMMKAKSFNQNDILDSIKLLIEKGADINAKTDKGETVIDYANLTGIQAVIEYINSLK
jgi:uncharacterized protein